MNQKILLRAEVFVIVILACVPLFVTFPYRVNVFLSWEGAYRLMSGHIPFKDFGLPLGGMYWVVPGIFFKIFGPEMITLVKAQVFINIVGGLAFRSILYQLKVSAPVRSSAVLLFCLSYSFFNFWPWYNHSVIIYELVGIAFALKGMFDVSSKKGMLYTLLSAFFIACSFYTKQDGGGMAFMIVLLLHFYNAYLTKNWKLTGLYTIGFAAFVAVPVIIFSNYQFGYWFNYGQNPHTARVSILEIIEEFFGASAWIKFYLFCIGLMLYIKQEELKSWFKDRAFGLFLILTIMMLGEAAVFQVTSYTPPDNNIFFHSFAVAFLLNLLSYSPVSATKVALIQKPAFLLVMVCGLLIWWSPTYWKYAQRILSRGSGSESVQVSPTGENVVNRKTFMIRTDSSEVPMSEWKFTNLKTFSKIYMPPGTVDGIDRLMKSPVIKSKPDLKVLNMSELTPLANEIPFDLERSPSYPLWYHLGVGMFNRDADMFVSRIAKKEYDLVLFEYIPTLNNFYPFKVRDALLTHYTKTDSFPAPRRGDTRGYIEVFVR